MAIPNAFTCLCQTSLYLQNIQLTEVGLTGAHGARAQPRAVAEVRQEHVRVIIHLPVMVDHSARVTLNRRQHVTPRTAQVRKTIPNIKHYPQSVLLL